MCWCLKSCKEVLIPACALVYIEYHGSKIKKIKAGNYFLSRYGEIDGTLMRIENFGNLVWGKILSRSVEEEMFMRHQHAIWHEHHSLSLLE